MLIKNNLYVLLGLFSRFINMLNLKAQSTILSQKDYKVLDDFLLVCYFGYMQNNCRLEVFAKQPYIKFCMHLGPQRNFYILCHKCPFMLFV